MNPAALQHASHWEFFPKETLSAAALAQGLRA